jgi:NADH:ubiquinone oxidoreductase subunit K
MNVLVPGTGLFIIAVAAVAAVVVAVVVITVFRNKDKRSQEAKKK